MRISRKLSRRSVLGLLSALVTTLACRTEGSPATALNLERIVSLGPAVTELLFELGFGSQIVGVDRASRYPKATQALPQLDYFRKVSAEGILGLSPTVVFATEGTGPAQTLAQLRATGGVVVDVPGADNPAQARERVTFLATQLGVPERGKKVVARFDAGLERVAALRSAFHASPSVLFVYARGPGSLFVSGRDTAAHTMIELAGGRNAATALTGFRPLTAEAVIEAGPEYIVLPARGLESIGGIDGLLTIPGVAQTPAGQERKIVAIDDLKLLGFGPRADAALLELFRGLHPTEQA